MNTLLLAVSLAACACYAGSVPAQTALSEGQRLYDLGDHRSAAAWYGQASAADPSSAALHYDRGNALFKAGQVGKAVASYQRAFDLDPRDSDIRQNLDFSLRRAGEELSPSGMPPLVFLAFHLLSERELAGLQWLACWLTLILAGLCLRRASWREKLLGGAMMAGALWIFIGLWWLAMRGVTPPHRGVIVMASVEARSGPGENFNVSFTAPEGRRVQILSENGAWLEIGVLKEGVKGWVPASAVEEI